MERITEKRIRMKAEELRYFYEVCAKVIPNGCGAVRKAHRLSYKAERENLIHIFDDLEDDDLGFKMQEIYAAHNHAWDRAFVVAGGTPRCIWFM